MDIALKDVAETELRRELIEHYIKKYLPCRQFITAKELVKSGLFGSKSAVSYEVRKNKLNVMWTSERRYVIVRESLVDNILHRTEEKSPRGTHGQTN